MVTLQNCEAISDKFNIEDAQFYNYLLIVVALLTLWTKLFERK